MPLFIGYYTHFLSLYVCIGGLRVSENLNTLFFSDKMSKKSGISNLCEPLEAAGKPVTARAIRRRFETSSNARPVTLLLGDKTSHLGTEIPKMPLFNSVLCILWGHFKCIGGTESL